MSDNRDEPYYVLPNSFEEEEARVWGRDDTPLVERAAGALREGEEQLRERGAELGREAPGGDDVPLVERVRQQLYKGTEHLLERRDGITARQQRAQEFLDNWTPRVQDRYPSGGTPQQKVEWWLNMTADLVKLTAEIVKQHLAEEKAHGKPLSREERLARDRSDLERLKKHPAFAKLQKGSRSAKIKPILPSDRELLGEKRRRNPLSARAKAAATPAVKPKAAAEPKAKRDNAGWSLNGVEKRAIGTARTAAAAAAFATAAVALRAGVKALGDDPAQAPAVAAQTATSKAARTR